MKNTDILKLYQSNSTILTFKDISMLWKSTNRDLVKRRVNYYVKTEKLYAIRRGIYAKDKNYNEYELASKIYVPSYISLETVLQKEGIIFQHYSSVFLISYLTREIKCKGHNISYKKIKNTVLTNPKGLIKEGNYYIASKERALLDTLYLYKDYYFDNLKNINWDKCFELVSIYENKNLKKKVETLHKSYARQK